MNRFLTNKFSEQYIVTIGSQFAVKIVDVERDSGHVVRVKLLVWDLAGQQRFDFIRSSYYKGSKGALLVFDTTRKSTWLELPKWIQETESALGHRIPIVLLANKVDLVDERVISTEMATDPEISKHLDAAISYVGGRCETLFSGVYVKENLPGLVAVLSVNGLDGR